MQGYGQDEPFGGGCIRIMLFGNQSSLPGLLQQLAFPFFHGFSSLLGRGVKRFDCLDGKRFSGTAGFGYFPVQFEVITRVVWGYWLKKEILHFVQDDIWRCSADILSQPLSS